MASLTSCYRTDNIVHNTNTNPANNVLHKINMMWHRQKKWNWTHNIDTWVLLVSCCGAKTELRAYRPRQKFGQCFPAGSTCQNTVSNICYGRRSKGRKLESQNGGISALTAQKHISEIWHNFLFNSESTVPNLCSILCIANFEGTAALGNHVINFLWHFSYNFFFNVGFHNENPS